MDQEKTLPEKGVGLAGYPTAVSGAPEKKKRRTEMELRIPPHSNDAEKGLLGSILMDPSAALCKCSEMHIDSDKFYDVRHQILFGELTKMSGMGKAMDTITITEWLKANGMMDRVGGFDYLAELEDSESVSGYVNHYADIVIKKHRLRNIIDKMSEAISAAYENEDPLCIASESMASMSSLLTVDPVKKKLEEHVSDWLDSCIRGECGTFPFWCHEWDMRLGKLSDEIIILHAPKSSGKTSLAIQWIVRGAREGYKMSFASIETTTERISPRFAAQIGEVNALLMRIRPPTNNEEKRTREAICDLSKLGISIRDGDMTINDIKAWAAIEKSNGADALMIDNLLSIKADRKYESKTIMYDSFLREIRGIRNRLKIPIIIIAHPNQEGQVAWSRDVENFADIIIYLMEVRNEGWNSPFFGKIEKNNTLGRHICAAFQKNRDGIRPLATLDFAAEIQTFKHIGWE